MLGIIVASALVAVIGSGVLQIGILVALAMLTATLLGGGELLTGEAAVSAILIVSLTPGASHGFTANRILEGVIGGAVALAVSSLLFPPDPRLAVARAAQSVFGGLGGVLERLASALAASDAAAAGEALDAARELDLAGFEEALETGRETARLSPRRRPALAALDRYGASFAQVDYAIRDTRVLARHSVRALRSGAPVPGDAARGRPRARPRRLVTRRRLRRPRRGDRRPRPRAARREPRRRQLARGLRPGPLARRRPAPRRRPRRHRARGRRRADRRTARHRNLKGLTLSGSARGYLP